MWLNAFGALGRRYYRSELTFNGGMQEIIHEGKGVYVYHV